MKKICIVQLENYHSEVIIPQLECLKENYEVHLYIPGCYLGKEGFSSFSYKEHNSLFSENEERFLRFDNFFLMRNLIYIADILRLRLIAKRYKFDLIIFNTVTNNVKARIICSILGKNKKIRILHNTSRDSDQLRNKFDLSLVLSKDLFINSYQYGKTGYFEPCFFDSFRKETDKTVSNPGNTSASDNIIKIGIIGKTDYKRRNYTQLFDVIEKYPEVNMVNYYIIGQTDKSIIEDIQKRGIEDKVIYNNGFFTFNDLLAITSQMDCIAYLIDPEVEDFYLYNRIKISGTANLCKFYNMPILSHEKLEIDESLRNNSLTYKNSIGEIIVSISKGEISKESLAGYRMSESEHLQYLAQEKKRYVDAIEMILNT